jgi:altronate dehydratase small subunit
MAKQVNAILIHESDDVATAIVELQKGDGGRYALKGEIITITISQHIPKFHKFAIRDIKKAELVRKYGEVIGQAAQDIGRGTHVHEHNLTGPAYRR